MLLGILTTYLNLHNKFYFWPLGYTIGMLVANSFVAIDRWADLNLITPMPAHDRYLNDYQTFDDEEEM